MTTTKNPRALADEINNIFASWRRSPGLPTTQQPTIGTKPPVASMTREAAEALESYLKRNAITLTLNETPFMRGLRRTVAFQKQIADDNARFLAAQSTSQVINPTIEAPMLTDCVPESPLPTVQRPIAPPMMVPRGRR